jgi:hypothetical protein
MINNYQADSAHPARQPVLEFHFFKWIELMRVPLMTLLARGLTRCFFNNH